MNLKLRAHVVAAALLVSVSTFASPISIASADVIPASNKLPDGFHFTATNSPYVITSTLMIDAGSTVTIDPDVVINAPQDQPLFWNLGTLKANGLVGHEIKILGFGNTLVKTKNATGEVNATFDHTVIRSLHLVDAYSNRTNLTITNSDLLATRIDTLGSVNLVASGNYFAFGGGIWLGSGKQTVTNNTFDGDGTIESASGTSQGLWIEARESSPDQVIFTGNNLIRLSRPAVAASRNGVLSASGNYWGTNDSDNVQSYVLDKNDSFDWPNIINVSGALNTTNSAAPAHISPAASSIAPNKIVLDTKDSILGIYIHKIVRATLFTSTNEPVAGVPAQIVTTESNKPGTLQQAVTNANGQVEAWLSFGTPGERTITFKSGDLLASVKLLVSQPYANLSVVGKKLTLRWGAAAGKTLGLRDGSSTLISKLATSDDELVSTFTLKPGKHALVAMLSGVKVAAQTITVKK